MAEEEIVTSLTVQQQICWTAVIEQGEKKKEKKEKEKNTHTHTQSPVEKREDKKETSIGRKDQMTESFADRMRRMRNN